MIKVYLASPYTNGDVAKNVKLQIDTSHDLMDLGYNPMVPLMAHFLQMSKTRDYEEWLRIDFDWISICDVLFRIPSDIPSPGADREVVHALSLGIPVVYSIDELIKQFPV